MKRYKHNLSHYHLTTGNFGKLYPVGWWDVLPGDSFRLSTSVFTRCTPLLAPVMHPVQIRLHTFFTPYRILSDEFEDFITRRDKTAQIPFAKPKGTAIEDYFGIPPRLTSAAEYNIQQFPFLAYSRIWKEYYRDQQLQENVDYLDIAPINYEKDFSTSARFDPSNDPAGSVALVKNDGSDDYVDALDIRKALAKQKFDEARSRFGARYTEYLQYLGIKPSDARLQRPEYCGGGVGNINFSEVLSTVETTDEPQGRLTGHGIAGVKSRPITKYFEEHGVLMTLLSVRPKLVYSDGLQRYWRSTGQQDWWQKEEELEGQMAIQGGEIFASGTTLNDSVQWGWQDRNYHLRSIPSRISGEMRTLYNYWHMARQYEGPAGPGLNQNYALVDDASSRRCFADQINDQLLFAINHRCAARRMVAPANKNPRTV